MRSPRKNHIYHLLNKQRAATAKSDLVADQLRAERDELLAKLASLTEPKELPAPRTPRVQSIDVDCEDTDPVEGIDGGAPVDRTPGALHHTTCAPVEDHTPGAHKDPPTRGRGRQQAPDPVEGIDGGAPVDRNPGALYLDTDPESDNDNLPGPVEEDTPGPHPVVCSPVPTPVGNGTPVVNPVTEGVTQLKVYKTIMESVKLMDPRPRIKLLKSLSDPGDLTTQRLATQLAKDAGVDRRTLVAPAPLPTTDKVKYDRRRELVLAFLIRPEHSYTMPGKKDTKTIKKKKHGKVVLCEFMHELHRQYLEEYPDEPIGLTFFQNVRVDHPYIILVTECSKTVCLCVKHQNFSLLLKAVGIRTLPDTVVRASTAAEFAQSLTESVDRDNISGDQWENVDVKYGKPGSEKTVKKMRLQPFCYTKADFINLIAEEFDAMFEHSERARIQHRVVRHLREGLSSGECTIQMDFAENWMVSYPDEVQSAYYAKEPVTLHPAVIHYRDDVTGKVAHSCLALVTDDRKHDAGAILAFLRAIVEFIRETLPDTIKTLHYVSDSPCNQYRNISIFSILCKHQMMFDGLEVTWTYLEAGHGKGPCDGVGASAKRSADLAVARNHVIRDATDFARQGNNDSKTVFYTVVPVKEIDRARKEVSSLVAWQSVKGTLQLHAVLPDIPNETIAMRRTSCFSECCWKDGVSLRQCPGWEIHRLFQPGPVHVAPVSPPAPRGRRAGARYLVPHPLPEGEGAPPQSRPRRGRPLRPPPTTPTPEDREDAAPPPPPTMSRLRGR